VADAWSIAARGRLEEIAKSLRGGGLEVEARVVVGTPDEKLAEIGETPGVHLAVVGFLGRRSADRWRAGSLPARLARSIAVPVLVVKDAEAFEACARGGRPLRVLLAADLSLASDAAVGWLGSLRRLGPCEITLLHSYDPVREWSRLGVRGRASIEGSPEVEAILLRDLRARLKGVLADDEVAIRILPSLDWTAETLASAAEREGFDVIVLGGHRRRGLARIAHDSVSERVLALAPASVVRIPLLPASVDSRAIPRLVRILAPTDLSELGNNAVRYAYAIAPAGSTVHLLHVVEEEPPPNPLYAHYRPGRSAASEERVDLQRGLEIALHALIPEEAERRGIQTKINVVHDGKPANVIRVFAEREGVDTICMGTHGRSGLSRLLGGSVAREIAAESPRPLFLVNPAAGE
jgi:nucleotide-binding universal stress UspA family protein